MEPLIYELMEDFHLIDKVSSDDPYGGVVKNYRVGASFQAKVIKNNSTEAIVAEKQGSTEFFTVVTKGLKLDFHDIFRRDSDNEYFICTAPEKDSVAPSRSTVKLAKATCERWEKPKGTTIIEGVTADEAASG